MSLSPCVYNRKNVCWQSHYMNMATSGCDVYLLLYFMSVPTQCALMHPCKQCPACLSTNIVLTAGYATHVVEKYTTHISLKSTDPEHQMSIPISWEKVSYIRVQNCGHHWMIVWRLQKRSHRSKHVWSLSATTNMNMNIKYWMWEYLVVAKGLDTWSRNHKTRTFDGRWDIPLQ